MSNLSNSAIHYRLTPDGAGLKLDIWEPAAKTDQRKASFHFYVSYQLSSPEEAQHVLDQYLLDNNVGRAVCLDAASVPLPTMMTSHMQTYA